MSNINLLHNLVAIKPREGSTVTEGGIHLVSPEKVSEGTVISVGPGIYLNNGKFVETTVKPGDQVVYPKNTGEELNINGEELLVMPETSIVGILKKEEG